MRAPALAVLVAVVTLACACGASARFTPADRAAVTGVLDAQVAAWNRGDLAAYMAGYARSDALVFTSGGKVRRGWQAAYDAYRTRYATDPAAMGQLGFEVLEVAPVGADAAVVLGRWVLTRSPADGSGVFSLVLARRPEGWRVIHDHTSADPPPAPTP